MYVILGTTEFSEITLTALILESILDKGQNREEMQWGKILLYQNNLLFLNYQYMKKDLNIGKITVRIFFFLLQWKSGFNVEEEEWSTYL